MISDKNNPVFCNKIKLISYETTENDYGETDPAPVSKTIWCAEIPVFSREFFAAQQNGIKAEKLFFIHTNEYENQLLVEYQGKKYSIYRTVPRSDRKTELYCSERIGNG